MKVAIKFCGSCNPEIDLSALAGHTRQFAAGRGDIELVPSGSPGVDLLILLCGCPRACVDNEELRAQARHNIVVSGNRLDGNTMPEKDLPIALTATIERAVVASGD